jgi:hypothetical protein
MKKCYITVLLLFLATHLQALEFSNTISVGELGLDTTFWSTTIYAHLINFTVQEESGFGIQITPVRALLDIETIGFKAVTFVNAMLYYDFFRTIDEIQLGPFASINTVNALKIDSAEYNAGLLFTLRTLKYDNWAFSDRISTSFDWLIVKTGYKYLDGESNFYIKIGLDLLTAVGILALSQGPQNKGINRR